MPRLIWLAVLSIVRQPTALAAFLLIPALLVFLTADAFEKFTAVLNAGGAHVGHAHGAHFTILAAMWAASVSSAIVAGMTFAETRSSDEILRLHAGEWRWSAARLLALTAATALAVAVSVGLAGLRDDVPLRVWPAAGYNALMYVLAVILLSAVVRDAVVAVGAVSALWVLDALTAPTMTSDTWWQPLVSPFYAAEHLAMGMEPSRWTLIGLIAWPLLLLWGFFHLYRTSAAPVPRTTTGAGRAPALSPSDEVLTDPHPADPGARPARRPRLHGLGLLFTDLARDGGLLGFVLGGPVTLMVSSLWLFQGIGVLVPAMIDGQRTLVPTTMQDLHAAYMGMIAVVSFSGTAGYLVGTARHEPDRRLGRGFGRLRQLSLLRLGTLLAIGVGTTISALVLVPLVRVPNSPGWFVFAHLLAAWTFVCIGYCVGLLLDRVAGILLMMLFPFVDVGIAQDYMLGPDLPDWAILLPSHPFAQLAVSSSFGESIFGARYVVAAVVVALAAAAAVLLVSGRQFGAWSWGRGPRGRTEQAQPEAVRPTR